MPEFNVTADSNPLKPGEHDVYTHYVDIGGKM